MRGFQCIRFPYSKFDNYFWKKFRQAPLCRILLFFIGHLCTLSMLYNCFCRKEMALNWRGIKLWILSVALSYKNMWWTNIRIHWLTLVSRLTLGNGFIVVSGAFSPILVHRKQCESLSNKSCYVPYKEQWLLNMRVSFSLDLVMTPKNLKKIQYHIVYIRSTCSQIKPCSILMN